VFEARVPRKVSELEPLKAYAEYPMTATACAVVVSLFVLAGCAAGGVYWLARDKTDVSLSRSGENVGLKRFERVPAPPRIPSVAR
jgi:hypothetical protein